MQSNCEDQVVKGIIDPVHNLIVKGFRADDAAVQITIPDQSIRNPSDKDPEDIADSEMNPYRVCFCLL